MKYVKDLTVKDFLKYISLRNKDNRWSREDARLCYAFYCTLPEREDHESRKKYNARLEQYFQESLSLLWDFEKYPNLKLDIKTGEYEKGHHNKHLRI